MEWFGTYRFDGDTDGRWRRCRILDISTAGAGVQLFESSIEEASDRLLVVQHELHGDVRNVVAWDAETVRASVEFPGLTGTAEEYVHELRRRGPRGRW